MRSNIIILTQPRCGGHMTLKVFEDMYPSHVNLYEQFSWQKQEIVPLNKLIQDALKKQPFILKVTWWDLRNNYKKIAKLPCKFYYLKRTDPFEMVCSSYLASTTGTYHKHINDESKSVDSITIPKEYVDRFLSSDDPGGWYYMQKENNPMYPYVKGCKVLTYNDKTTPSMMYHQITGKHKDVTINFEKQYPSKESVVTNADEVKQWIKNAR